MNEEKKWRSGFGLIRSYGWKKNLLSVLVCFLLCRGFAYLSTLLSDIRVISDFDPAVAILPIFGFLQGIWGVIGCLLSGLVSAVQYFLIVKPASGLPSETFYVAMTNLVLIVYSALPAVLWYSIPLRGEERVRYPRLDTSLHVFKYYLIMLVSVAVLVAFYGIGTSAPLNTDNLLSWAVLYTQYLNAVLIVGIPVVVVVSVIRNRTVTINERMVLAFLLIGVIASVIGAYLLYRTSYYLDPDLFQEYDVIVKQSATEWSEDSIISLERYFSFWNWYYVMLAVMLNALLLIEMLFMRSIEKKVTKPILHLSDVLEQYTAHEEGSLDPGTVTARCKPYRYGYGEVSNLTRTCVGLVQEVENYTENLKTVTAEKERIGAELDVASKIQRDMLPGVFPPFPDREEIDLYASMTPAKEVGGDFYDFYFIDQDHLALTIADVSGKGVPASLFMVISKTLLKNHAQSGGSPKEILTYVNHLLRQNNDSFMFCTAWLGILELSSGRLLAANAGHEYPVIRRKNGVFELLMDEHDPALGVLDGLRYHEYELLLEPGDCLFQYTDGVTEATDADLAQFGEERIVQILNENPDAGAEEQIRRLHDAIHAFVKDAPQFDDITMLAFRYVGPNRGAKPETSILTVPARVESLDEVNAFVQEKLEAVDCDEDLIFSFTLVVEEIFVNIANYAYDGGDGDARISLSFDPAARLVELVFTDSGMPFDPVSQPDPDITLRPEERRIGGLGIHIVKQTMDEVFYNYEAGKNVLTVRKHI
ncbi:MAG: SpoIIE family protein phosphatase [Blautia sp.]|nr:SpoIIE family protein phosphatase [Blautia sp.]